MSPSDQSNQRSTPGVVNAVPELQDFAGPLHEFSAILSRLVERYGPNARIEFDAGYNNVSVYIRTPRDHS